MEEGMRKPIKGVWSQTKLNPKRTTSDENNKEDSFKKNEEEKKKDLKTERDLMEFLSEFNPTARRNKKESSESLFKNLKYLKPNLQRKQASNKAANVSGMNMNEMSVRLEVLEEGGYVINVKGRMESRLFVKLEGEERILNWNSVEDIKTLRHDLVLDALMTEEAIGDLNQDGVFRHWFNGNPTKDLRMNLFLGDDSFVPNLSPDVLLINKRRLEMIEIGTKDTDRNPEVKFNQKLNKYKDLENKLRTYRDKMDRFEEVELSVVIVSNSGVYSNLTLSQKCIDHLVKNFRIGFMIEVEIGNVLNIKFNEDNRSSEARAECHLLAERITLPKLGKNWENSEFVTEELKMSLDAEPSEDDINEMNQLLEKEAIEKTRGFLSYQKIMETKVNDDMLSHKKKVNSNANFCPNSKGFMTFDRLDVEKKFKPVTYFPLFVSKSQFQEQLFDEKIVKEVLPEYSNALQYLWMKFMSSENYEKFYEEVRPTETMEARSDMNFFEYYSDPDVVQGKKKYKRMLFPLNQNQKLNLALDGVGAKSFYEQGNKEVIEKQNETKRSYSFLAEMGDITNYIVKINPCEVVGNNFPEMRTMRKIWQWKVENLNISIDRSSRWFDSISNTRTFVQLQYVSRIAEELNLSLNQRSESNVMIVKRIPGTRLQIMIHSTGALNHIFYSLGVFSNFKPDNDTVCREWKRYKNSNFYYTDFVSCNKHRLGHYLNIHLKWAGLFANFSELKKRDDIEMITAMQNMKDLDEVVEDQKRTMNYLELWLLESRTKTSADLFLPRYMYQKLTQGLNCKNRPSEVFSKLDEKPRGRFQLWSQKVMMESFVKMSGSVLKGKREERINDFLKKSQETPKAAKKNSDNNNNDEIETGKQEKELEEEEENLEEKEILLNKKIDKFSSDDLGGLLNWITGLPIHSYEHALNLSYLGVFHSKDDSDKNAGAFKMMKKIISEEIKLRKTKRPLMGFRDSKTGEYNSHEFSRTFVWMAVKRGQKYLSDSYGQNWREVIWEKIYRELGASSTESKSTLKASTIRPKKFPKFPIKDFEEFESLSKKLKKEIVKEAKTTTEIEQRRRVMEGVMELLDSELCTEKAFSRISKIYDYILKKGGVWANIFAKPQNTGIREIFVLCIHSRFLIAYLESISRTLCEEFDNEMLTKGSKKILKTQKFNSDTSSVRSRFRNSKVVIESFDSCDATTWCQKFINPMFYSAMHGFLNEDLRKSVAGIMNEHTKKRIELPFFLCKTFVTKPEMNSLDAENIELKNQFLGKGGNKDLLDIGECAIKNLSNMMQGIEHYTSSFLHAITSIMINEMTIDLMYEKTAQMVLGFYTKNKDYEERFDRKFRITEEDKTKWRQKGRPLDAVESFIRGLIFENLRIWGYSKVSSDDSSYTRVLAISKSLVEFLDWEKLCWLGSHFMEACYPFFGAQLSKEKSTLNSMKQIEEFNSVWHNGNTVISPIIKFVGASLENRLILRLDSRQNVMADLVKQVTESGGTHSLASKCSLLQSIIHYSNLGMNVSPMFDKFWSVLTEKPHPSLGLFLFEDEELDGMMGYDYKHFLAVTNNEKINRMEETLINSTNVDVDTSGKIGVKISLLIGGLSSYFSFLKRMKIPYDWQEYFNVKENQTLLFGSAKNSNECKMVNYKKALSSGVADSFSFQAANKVHVGSAYIHSTPCLTVKMTKEECKDMNLEKYVVNKEILKVQDKIRKNTITFEEISTDTTFLDYDLNEKEKQNQVRLKLSLIRLIRAIKISDKKLTKDLHIHFPLTEVYSMMREIVIRSRSFERKLQDFSRRRTYVELDLVKVSLEASVNIKKLILNKWYGVPIHHGESEVNSSWRVFKGKIPWLAENAEDTLKLSPFSSILSLADFLNSFSDRTKTVKILSAVKRKQSLEGTLLALVKRNQSRVWVLRQKSVKMTPTYLRRDYETKLVNSLLSQVLTGPCNRDDKLKICKSILKKESSKIDVNQLKNNLEEINMSSGKLSVMSLELIASGRIDEARDLLNLGLNKGKKTVLKIWKVPQRYKFMDEEKDGKVEKKKVFYGNGQLFIKDKELKMILMVSDDKIKSVLVNSMELFEMNSVILKKEIMASNWKAVKHDFSVIKDSSSRLLNENMKFSSSLEGFLISEQKSIKFDLGDYNFRVALAENYGLRVEAYNREESLDKQGEVDFILMDFKPKLWEVSFLSLKDNKDDLDLGEVYEVTKDPVIRSFKHLKKWVLNDPLTIEELKKSIFFLTELKKECEIDLFLDKKFPRKASIKYSGKRMNVNEKVKVQVMNFEIESEEEEQRILKDLKELKEWCRRTITARIKFHGLDMEREKDRQKISATWEKPELSKKETDINPKVNYTITYEDDDITEELLVESYDKLVIADSEFSQMYSAKELKDMGADIWDGEEDFSDLSGVDLSNDFSSFSTKRKIKNLEAFEIGYSSNNFWDNLILQTKMDYYMLLYSNFFVKVDESSVQALWLDFVFDNYNREVAEEEGFEEEEESV